MVLENLSPAALVLLAVLALAFLALLAWRLLYVRGVFSPLAAAGVVESSGDGYLLVDARGRVAALNAAACGWLRLDTRQSLRQPVETVLAGWPTLLQLLRGAPGDQAVFPIQAATPVTLEASLRILPHGENTPGRRLVILHDITRQRLVEENLRVSERLYRLLVDNAPVGIYVTDPDGKISYASPKISELYHLAPDTTLIGASPLVFFLPEDHRRMVKAMTQAMVDQETPPPQEYRLVRGDGSLFWGEVAVSPVVDDRGGSRGVLAITNDVTGRKELELSLKHNLERQTFINNLLQVLYRPHDRTAALAQVLEHVGLFLDASRVYLCRDSADGLETTIASEWCSALTHPRARESALVRYAALPSFKKEMESSGRVLAVDSAPLPEDLAEFMAAWNARSLVAFPVYGSEERLYGFLAVDHCREPRNWSPDDLDLFALVCRIVSGAVAQIQAEAAERRQRALAEALHDTASALNSTLDLEDVLDRILSNLERVVSNVPANIALVDDKNVVRIVRWRGYDEDGETLDRDLRVVVDEVDAYREMAQTGEPVIIPDTWLDKEWVSTQANRWIRSYAGMPIRIKGRVTGYINLDSPEPEFFTPDLSYSLHVFADQAAVAIDNARLYDDAHHRVEEMRIINRIGLTLTAGLEMDQVLVSLFDECRRVLPVDVFYVALYDAEIGRLDFPLYFNEGDFQTVETRQIGSEPGLTGEVIRQKRTIWLPDMQIPGLEEHYGMIPMGGRWARSYVGVPLILVDQVVGVISMQSYAAYAYTPEQIGLLETIATQAAIAVQNARLYDQMKQMAITDPVTGLHTRRHFTALGRSEVGRALRYGRRLGVLMVDIDHFKRVNDSYGHNAGDVVLHEIAEVCRGALRQTDIVGRWGGEEFAIVLPEADRDGAALIAERIRRMVSEMHITIGEDRISVTVSVGVAALGDMAQGALAPETGCCSLENLIDSADRALYAAKQAGRNLVRVLEG